jgi:hypothetical protein
MALKGNLDAKSVQERNSSDLYQPLGLASRLAVYLISFYCQPMATLI